MEINCTYTQNPTRLGYINIHIQDSSIPACKMGEEIVLTLYCRWVDISTQLLHIREAIKKKNLQPKCPDTSKFGILGKPTKKLELNPLFQSIFETSKFQKLKKSYFFLFWKNIFLTPPPLNCLYLRPSISVFTNFFFAESVMDSSIILK